MYKKTANEQELFTKKEEEEESRLIDTQRRLIKENQQPILNIVYCTRKQRTMRR